MATLPAFAQPQDDARLADDGPTKPQGRTLWRVDRKLEPELQPVMSTAELRAGYPDLELRTVPGATVTVGISTIYPLQAIAFGVGTEFYLQDVVRVSSFLSCGLTPTVNEQWQFSLFGELGLGVPILRRRSETVVELPIIAARLRRQEPEGPIARAVVPSGHSLEVEAGMLSGTYNLYRCTANCDGVSPLPTREPVGMRLWVPYAGLRYVYYRLARSEQAPFRSASRFQMAADVLVAPYDPPDPDLFNLYDEHPSNDRIGGRVVLKLPAITCTMLGPCFGIDMSGGYLPSPADVLVTFGLSVY